MNAKGEVRLRSVASFGIAGRRQRVDSDLEHSLRLVFCALRVLDALQDLRELVAHVDGDDGGRRFVRAEAVVVARSCDGGAKEVCVLVDRLYDGAEHREEYGVLVRIGAGVEEVLAAVGDGPVVVLAGAVDACVRLLVEEALESVPLGDVAQRVHHEHVVVRGEVQLLELRRELELRWRDLVVARLRRYAELPELPLDVVHEREDAVGDRAEVVVLELLALCGRRAEERAAREDEVGALLPVLLVHEEVFLLRAERARRMAFGASEELHEALQRLVERLHRAQEGRLLVERLARVGAERRRDAQGRAVRVALDERGGGRIPRRVAARLEGGADAARRERARVRLADDEVLSAELHDRLAVLQLEERVVLLGGGSRHRQEPVRVMRGAAVHRPVADAMRHLARDGGVERLSFPDRRLEFLGGVLAEVCPDRLFAEHVGAEVGCSLCLFRHFRFPFMGTGGTRLSRPSHTAREDLAQPVPSARTDLPHGKSRPAFTRDVNPFLPTLQIASQLTNLDLSLPST